MKIYYFGCVRESGHFLWVPPGKWPPREVRHSTPWGETPDSLLAPHKPECNLKELYRCRCPQPEGEAVLHHKDGWTALGFWDRSLDHRGNSNSNFLAEGVFTFEEMVKLAQEHFPQVWSRFTFTITQAKEPKHVQTTAA